MLHTLNYKHREDMLETDSILKPLVPISYNKASIVRLTARHIENMSHQQLVDVIDASDLFTVHYADFPGQLGLYDRETLVRLAHMAQRCCQNDLAMVASPQEQMVGV